MTIACHRSPIDRLTLVQLIRGIFSRSPTFRESVISEAMPGRKGEVVLVVSFDRGPTLFRVVAPSAGEAYSMLYELAAAMIETDSKRRAVRRE
jgi:hypothetical protein